MRTKNKEDGLDMGDKLSFIMELILVALLGITFILYHDVMRLLALNLATVLLITDTWTSVKSMKDEED